MELALVIIVGLLIGSFLNVCIYRIPRSESIVFGSSHCTNCNEKIKAYDLIPVISYILLGGKCRNCKTKISIKYPLIEFLNAVLYAGLFIKYGLNMNFYIFAFITSIFITIAFIDFELQIIPNEITIVFLIIAVIYRITIALQGANMLFLYDGLIAAFAAFIVFYLLFVLSKGGMGGGDVKVIFPIGLLVGVEKISLLVLISSVIASLYAFALILLKKANRKTPIPFGTFLAIGVYVVLMMGI